MLPKELKENVQLKNYVLWLAKGEVHLITGLMGLIEKEDALLAQLNHEKAKKGLFRLLTQFGIKKQDQIVAINELYETHCVCLNEKQLIQSTPELLILSDSASN